MIKFFKQFFKKTYYDNEDVSNLIIKKLHDVSNWSNDVSEQTNFSHDIKVYTYKNDELKLELGPLSDSLHLSYPIYFAFDSATSTIIIELLDKISNDETKFLCEYMNNEFKAFVLLTEDNYDNHISDIKLWMEENNTDQGFVKKRITETNNYEYVIWFKNQEDAMAFKLRWI